MAIFAAIMFAQTNVSIYEIQYTTDPGEDNTYPSPYLGQIVTTTGVITATGFDGDKFFISMPEGGAWKGIYIYHFTDEVSVGDIVQVTGTVDEYYGFTEIKFVTELNITGQGTVPAPISVSTSDVASNEAYESILVKISNVTVTQEESNYGEWFVTDGSGPCQIDNGFFYLDDEGITVTVGQTWASITGVVDYSYNEFGINPRTPSDLNQDTHTSDSKSWAKIKSLYK